MLRQAARLAREGGAFWGLGRAGEGLRAGLPEQGEAAWVRRRGTRPFSSDDAEKARQNANASLEEERQIQEHLKKSLPNQLRFGQAMPEDWKKERESKQRASWWFRGLRGATNLAMLYLAGSILYDLYLKGTGQKAWGTTPYPEPPDWMVRADQQHLVEERRRSEVEAALAAQGKAK